MQSCNVRFYECQIDLDSSWLTQYTGKNAEKFCPSPQKIVFFLKMGICYPNLLKLSKLG